MENSKLMEDLEYQTDQRPSQQEMDEFINKAKILKSRLTELEEKPCAESQ